MDELYDLVITGGTVVNHDGIGVRDIGVRGGKIAHLGTLHKDQAADQLDATGLHILPGVIDSQVHFREPGGEHKEDLGSGSRAAVMGGVTAVFEMPNTSPLTTNANALADKVCRARGRMFCDFAFYVGGTAENVDEIPELERLPGSAGIKVFIGSSTGDLLVDREDDLARIIGALSRRAAFHSEDEERLRARASERIKGDPASHFIWRDPEAALISTKRLVRLARAAGKRIHVLHISTLEEMAFLSSHKDVATLELTSHHLTLSAPEAYAKLGTKVQMNPPVRQESHRQALWQGLENGLVDVLGSDHAPHTVEEKSIPYPGSPSGMPGVQTLVPIMLDHVNSGRLSLARFVDLTSHGPGRIFGISGKGRIACGYDADFTIVDMNKRCQIDDQWMESRAGWTPYHGQSVTGWPIGTIIRGRVVMWEDVILGKASGEIVKFMEVLAPRT